MGFLILPGQWSVYISDSLKFRPWRLLVIVNTLPGMVAALCLSRLPESGKFLLTRVRPSMTKVSRTTNASTSLNLQGLEDDAITVLRRIYHMNTGRPLETFSVHALLPESGSMTSSASEQSDISMDKKNNVINNGCMQQFWQQTMPLFQRPLRFHFLICCFLVFGVFFVSAGIGMWYPEIQNRIARSNATDSDVGHTVCDVLESAMHRRPPVSAEADILEEV